MILTVIDHASRAVPADIDLGIDPALMSTHIAWDIGAAELGKALGFPVHAATVSRLVIDMNRDENSPALVPRTSDGIVIPGNQGDVSARIERFFRPYHAALAARIDAERPAMLLSLHSFTPRLASDPEPRPWEVGVLYNNDDRAARVALPLLEAAGIVAGDQQPYSGKLLNATMNRHAEARGLAYLGLEVRQDLIDNREGVKDWAERLRPIVVACALAVGAPSTGLERRN